MFMISGSNEQLRQELEYTLLKPDCNSWWISKMQSGLFKLGKMPCDESWIYCYDRETKRQSSQWKHAGSPRPKKARQQIHPQTFDDPFFDSTVMIYMHWVPTGQTVNKEYYVEIRSEEASTLQIGSVAFPPGQCTSLQLHPCHRLFDQDGHQDNFSLSL